MAYNHTTFHASDLPHRIFAAIGWFFSMTGNAIVLAATTNSRLQEVDRLSAKSDAQLEAMGLRREDIVRYVFRDMLDV